MSFEDQHMEAEVLFAEKTQFQLLSSSTSKEEFWDPWQPFGQDAVDGLMMLSRENSTSFCFSREASLTLARESSAVLSSVSLIVETPLPMSRENSQTLAAEEISMSVCVEQDNSSVELSQLVANAKMNYFFPPRCDDCEEGKHATETQQSESAGEGAMFISDIPYFDVSAPIMADSTPQCGHSGMTANCSAVPCCKQGRGAPGAANPSKRGHHVKGRPEMQQTARDGAVHWSRKLQAVRAVWAIRATVCPEFVREYQRQMDLALGRIKSKQECLLRTLQLAAADGLIRPGPFGQGGYFGWQRFDVVPSRAAQFRRAVESLFAPGFLEDALKETFRRAGLVPYGWQWEFGWAGIVPWMYTPRARK